MTYIKAAILIFTIMAFAAGLGALAAGPPGVVAAIAATTVLHFAILWKADRILLELHDAREIDASETDPMLRALRADCHMLARRAGMIAPKVHVFSSDQPNAFAAGRDVGHASLVFTTGLFTILDREEARAVIAHELAHIRNGDALPMGIVAALGAMVSKLMWLAAFPFGKAEPAARLGARMVARLSSGRAREYRADRDAARICSAPERLASALEKIERGATAVINPFAERHPAIAHLYAVDPLRGDGRRDRGTTHPPTVMRVARLRAMARRGKRETAA